MKFKKFRLILGISLCIQAVTFFILALINLEKKKGTAAAFAAIGAAGGAAGGIMVYKEIRERRENGEFDDLELDFDDELDDMLDEDFDPEDILCTFDDDKCGCEECGEEKEEAAEAAE